MLEVRPGDEVTVDVDRDLADSGWFVVAARRGRASRAASRRRRSTSRASSPTSASRRTITVEIRKLARPQEDAPTVGVWQFAIVPG